MECECRVGERRLVREHGHRRRILVACRDVQMSVRIEIGDDGVAAAKSRGGLDMCEERAPVRTVAGQYADRARGTIGRDDVRDAVVVQIGDREPARGGADDCRLRVGEAAGAAEINADCAALRGGSGHVDPAVPVEVADVENIQVGIARDRARGERCPAIAIQDPQSRRTWYATATSRRPS